jgi:hypothetical protein
MQYQVPQFIEVEDKIFGPLTIRQFLYVAGAGGLCLIFFSILPFYLFIVLSIPVAALGAALAFIKINEQPFVVALEHGLSYFFGTKLYLWKQRKPEAPKAVAEVKTAGEIQMSVPKLSQSRLKDLAWSLNIKDRSQMGVKTEERTGFEI